ncbi:hypothetical protein [Microvirga rosea]|nr:hypothetical protein [Microvirga rosea]MCB8821011.1 hypothetical protein [Microvirga rosea]
MAVHPCLSQADPLLLQKQLSIKLRLFPKESNIPPWVTRTSFSPQE